MHDNIIITQSGRKMKQVGTMALRDAEGNFLPSQPLYTFIDDKDINPETGMTKREEKNMDDISAVLGRKFKEYVDGCRAAGIKVDI